MFEDAGSKLKTYAKVVFWIGAVASCIVGLIMLFASYGAGDFGGVILALVVAAVGVLGSYLSILMLLAFGELVESSTANAYLSRKILDELRAKKITQTRSPVSEATQTQFNNNQATYANFWYCNGCGAKNSILYGTCSECGKRRDS